jgi:hypothetical protein
MSGERWAAPETFVSYISGSKVKVAADNEQPLEA